MLLSYKSLAAACFVFTILFNACKENEPAPDNVRVQPKPVTPIPEPPRPYGMDKSPLDIIYFPIDYPVLKMSGKVTAPPVARVIYSRPSKDGRPIFGHVVKYGSYWRLGANEGTEIEFFTDVTIVGKKVNKGRYVLYCVPFEDKWTLVLNNDLFTWGLKIHTQKDVASFDVPAIKVQQVHEYFTMEFQPTANGVQLVMAWDNVRAALPIRY